MSNIHFSSRLQEIGREIKARISKLDHLGGKAVDMYDSINCLLKEAEGLCDVDGFAAFKQTYCPELGQSRTYELLAVQQGRKTLEEIRDATRLRVAKHRAKKKGDDVTEKDSVTSVTPAGLPDKGHRQRVQAPNACRAWSRRSSRRSVGSLQASMVGALLTARTEDNG